MEVVCRSCLHIDIVNIMAVSDAFTLLIWRRLVCHPITLLTWSRLVGHAITLLTWRRFVGHAFILTWRRFVHHAFTFLTRRRLIDYAFKVLSRKLSNTFSRMCIQFASKHTRTHAHTHTHARTHARTHAHTHTHTHTHTHRERERKVAFSLHPNIRQYNLTVTGMQEMTLSHPKSSSARKSAITITRPEDCQGTGGRVTQLPYPGGQGKERAATDVASARTN